VPGAEDVGLARGLRREAARAHAHLLAPTLPEGEASQHGAHAQDSRHVQLAALQLRCVSTPRGFQLEGRVHFVMLVVRVHALGFTCRQREDRDEVRLH